MTVRPWPTPAYLDTEFLEWRTTASRPKAELLESLITVLRMHPNGQDQSFSYADLTPVCFFYFVAIHSKLT